jgi:2-oxoglutarate dehydrogenase complex dehydrogenase (E1) component-like enzyme
MVKGIIGNTHGVKSAATPKPNASSARCTSIEHLASVIFRVLAADPEALTS